MSWFAGYYYAVILIAVLSLNNFLERIDNKGYISFLVISFALTQFSWTGSLLEGLMSGLRVLLIGIFLYAFGGYLRRYDPLSGLRTYVIFLVIIITYFLVAISAYNNTENRIESYIRNKTEDTFLQNISAFPNYSIIVIIIGICLFEIFRRVHIPQNKFLNYLGQATFMVYLLHDNGFFYSIWDTQDWITLLYNYPYKFIVKLFIWSCYVFIFGVIIYTFYIILAKLFNKYKWILFKK